MIFQSTTHDAIIIHSRIADIIIHSSYNILYNLYSTVNVHPIILYLIKLNTNHFIVLVNIKTLPAGKNQNHFYSEVYF